LLTGLGRHRRRLAGAHTGAGGKPKAHPPRTPLRAHGLEGREQVLTDAIIKAVREAKPNNGETLNFTPDQQRMLGLAVSRPSRPSATTPTGTR
jgi:hypothetical protein